MTFNVIRRKLLFNSPSLAVNRAAILEIVSRSKWKQSLGHTPEHKGQIGGFIPNSNFSHHEKYR
jgi:hypothetical protein